MSTPDDRTYNDVIVMDAAGVGINALLGALVPVVLMSACRLPVCHGVTSRHLVQMKLRAVTNNI